METLIKPHTYAAYALGLQCLSLSHKKDTWLIWVKAIKKEIWKVFISLYSTNKLNNANQKSHLEFQYCKTLMFGGSKCRQFLYLDLLADFDFLKNQQFLVKILR